jgi:regulator of protease activity HflC (stomatin/prohibitin superfamily)
MRITDVLVGVSLILWLGAIAAVVLITLQKSRGQEIKNSRNIIIGVLAAALVLSTISAGLVFIEPEERGVVISALSPKGYRDEVLQPGLRWIVPFVERTVIYAISKQTYTMSILPSEGAVFGDDSISARTKDGQEVIIDASVIFEVDPLKVVPLHIAWQNRYREDLVRPQVRGVIRDAVSQFGVEEVVAAKRFDMTKYVTSTLTTKFAENGITLVDFVLRNITFSKEYAASIEKKQIAEQEAKQAAYTVEQKRQEANQVIETAKGQKESAIIAAEGAAQARILQAKAEAEAFDLLAAALKGNPELLSYLYISKLSPTIETMLLPSGNPFVFQLPSIGTRVP